MTKRIRILAVASAALLAVGVVSPRPARADLDITVSINGFLVGSQTSTTDSNLFNIGTISHGGATWNSLLIVASTNFPGGSNGNLTQESITGAGSTGSGTLTVNVVETGGFTSPGGSGTQMNLQSNVSRSDGETGTTLTFQSFSTDINNNSVSPGQQTFNPLVGVNVSPNQVSVGFVRGATYPLSSTLTLTAGDSANINVNGSTTVTAVPEPSTMAIAGLGALGMIGYGLRRRKAMGA